MINSTITGFQKQYEHAVKNLPEQGHAHARQMTGGYSRLASITSGLDEVSKSRSPTETDAAHNKRTMQSSGKALEAISKLRGWLDDGLGDGLREIHARRDQKADLTPHALQAEIRAEFRSLPQSEKLKKLGEWIEANDGPLLGSILNPQVPEILSGVNATMAQQFRQTHYVTHAPEEVAEAQRLLETYESLIGATREADKVAQAYSDPEGLAAIEKGEQAAADAAAKFARATI